MKNIIIMHGRDRCNIFIKMFALLHQYDKKLQTSLLFTVWIVSINNATCYIKFHYSISLSSQELISVLKKGIIFFFSSSFPENLHQFSIMLLWLYLLQSKDILETKTTVVGWKNTNPNSAIAGIFNYRFISSILLAGTQRSHSKKIK